MWTLATFKISYHLQCNHGKHHLKRPFYVISNILNINFQAAFRMLPGWLAGKSSKAWTHLGLWGGSSKPPKSPCICAWVYFFQAIGALLQNWYCMPINTYSWHEDASLVCCNKEINTLTWGGHFQMGLFCLPNKIELVGTNLTFNFKQSLPWFTDSYTLNDIVVHADDLH